MKSDAYTFFFGGGKEKQLYKLGHEPSNLEITIPEANINDAFRAFDTWVSEATKPGAEYAGASITLSFDKTTIDFGDKDKSRKLSPLYSRIATILGLNQNVTDVRLGSSLLDAKIDKSDMQDCVQYMRLVNQHIARNAQAMQRTAHASPSATAAPSLAAAPALVASTTGEDESETRALIALFMSAREVARDGDPSSRALAEHLKKKVLASIEADTKRDEKPAPPATAMSGPT